MTINALGKKTSEWFVYGTALAKLFENGLLEVRFPKVEKPKTRKIKVKAQTPQASKKKRERKRKQTTA